VDLVDEQHVAALEAGEDGREILRLLEHRPGRLPQVDAQLGGDDVAQRRLAQARRAEQQHVIEHLGALARRADEDLELLARLGLADVVRQPLGTQRALHRLLVRRGRAGGHHARLARGARPRAGEVVGLYGHSVIIGVSAGAADGRGGAGVGSRLPPASRTRTP
jgi:hypothetical protein